MAVWSLLRRRVMLGGILLLVWAGGGARGMGRDDSPCLEICRGAPDCLKGCQEWRSGCEQICGREDALACDGCRWAVAHHLEVMRRKVGTIPAPSVVPGSVGSREVVLTWPTLSIVRQQAEDNSTLAVQWRLEKRQHETDWFDADTTDIVDGSQRKQVKVLGLVPYTSYQFRLVAELGAGHGRHTLANSPPSLGVSTEPEGPPATPPSILSVRQLPNLNINITFIPPEFPNGEIFFYRLYIKEIHGSSHFYFAAKEIPPSVGVAASARQSYTTGPMSCNTTYNVMLSAVNPAGESSNASHQFSTTCPWTPSVASIPFALFSSGNAVFRKDIRGGDYIWDIHVKMLQIDEEIVSFDLHQRMEFLYLCTRSGKLYRAKLSPSSAKPDPDQNLTGNPEELTLRMMGRGEAGRAVAVAVDWLNDKLYFLLETSGSRTFWSIAHCNIVATNCVLMEKQFLAKPEDFKVDPYHGYMYWMQRWQVAGINNSALYRMDLREEGGCGGSEVQMIKGNKLGSFVVSFSQYAIFVPILDKNQMQSVSLSQGFQTTIVHQNYRGQHGFDDVKAMVMYDGTYVWTSKEGFNVEEYHPDEGVYSFGLTDNTIDSSQMVLYHPVAQPTPAPVNHVENVQVIFGATRASIKWTEPQVGGDEGCAAWRSWSYRVRVNNKVYDNVVEYDNATMENISRDGTFAINTLYSVQVQAYSEGGSGPWSLPFTSSTWSTKETPLFFWSNTESLYSMNLFGHNMKPVGRNTGNASNIAWHSESDSLFWTVGNNVYRKIVSQDKPVVVVSENWTIDGMAVDYFAKKLYYSVPSLQRISRVSLSGEGRMSLPLTTVAKTLAIDSSLAKICWISLRNFVECSYLDGSNRQIIKEIGMWEEQKIVTMTLDPKKHIVYYIIYNPIIENRYTIYKKSIEHLEEEQQVAVLSSQKVDGPMHFRSNKLFYVEDMSFVVTHDVIGMGKSRILLNDRLEDFAITSVKSDFYPANTDGSTFVVVPNPVKETSVIFIGKSSNFSLTWDPVDNVNYGVVQYEVRMFSKSWTVQTNSMTMLDKVLLDPFTAVNVSVMAFTTWAKSKPAKTQLLTPSSVPTKPEHVRVFWTPVNDTMTMFTIRWKEPRKLNGRLLHYVLRCVDSVSSTDACLGTMVGPGVTTITIVMSSGNRYRVTVAGVTGVGRGKESDPMETSGSWIRPVPRVVVGVSQRPPAIVIADADSGTSTQHRINSQPEHMAFLHKENVVFTVDRDGRIARLELSSGRSREVLYLEQGVADISIDWLGHYLYWAVDEADVSYIRRIDLNKDRPDQQDILNTTDHIHDISYHPSGQLFYTAEEDNVSRLYVTRLNVNGRASIPAAVTGRGRRSVEASDRCDCPSIQSIRNFVVLPNNDPEDNEAVRLALRDTSTGFIHLADWNLCKCRMIAETDPTDLIKLDADFTNVYAFSSMQRGVRMIDLERDSKKNLDVAEVTSFGVACQECQRITQEGCLLTRAAQLPIDVLKKRSSSVILKLPSPKPRESCSKPIPLPSTNYTVYYAPKIEDRTPLCDRDRNICSKLAYYSEGNYGNRIVEVKKLKPNTKYAFYVAIENIYTQKEDAQQIFEIAAWVTTLEGAPSAPRDFMADVMSPTEILVTWKPPTIIHSDSIQFEIHWKSEGFIQGKKKNGFITLSGLDTSLKSKNGEEIRKSLLTELVPSQVYTIWLIAKSRTGIFNESSKTDPLRVKTFSQPNKLMKLGAGPRAINVSWTSPTEDIVKDHMILFYPKNDETTPHSKVVPEKPVVTQPLQTYKYNILNLSPGVTYIMKVKVNFKTNPKHYYIWPKDDNQYFETVQDYPLTPGVPYFSDSTTHGKVNITWKENDENVESYELQSLFIESGHSNESTTEHTWTKVYYDSKNYYLVTGLYNGTYSFRVKAKNRFGYSNFSEPSEPRDIDQIRMSQYIYGENSETVFQTIVGVSVALLSLFICMICIVVHKSRRNMDKKVAWDAIRPSRPPDLELANIRVFPLSPGIGNNANNPMYLIDIPTDEDLSVITKIKRSQITLSKFLGSGAFGEVFEGLVREPESDESNKIAVKTLRKGASDSEKIEFLKEAKLMWNFKHDHILNLIAICLDNDPNFLILELMEGGDLLSYLRSNRPNALNPGLSVGDQVSMCLDVAKGCEYLEQMHFVHRDIAARNCLVSSTDPDKRRVKIGDFGLARDIYKNDYYKKEGEGLLPVRWMAPESLMDGVFTTQSDVWSFGVVLWEILTMGAKPYPAMSNVEVLQYVRSGGRLQQPVGSPTRLHTIMSSCWDYKPDKRPTFKMCVEEIDSILDYADQLNEMSTSYVPFISAGYLNAPSVVHPPSFKQNEYGHPPSFNRMSTGSSVSSHSHYHSATTCPVSQISRNTRRTASSGLGSATPNYLELLHDAECEELGQAVAFHHHGYHVPRSTPTPSSCGCDSRASSVLGGPQGYQNLRTTHLYSCDSTGSAGSSRIE